MIKTKSEPLEGVSHAGYGVGGLTNLWECIFWGAWAGAPKGLPAILFGGWRDDMECQQAHHVQRINLMRPPSMDIEALRIHRAFPLSKELLIRQGFITAKAKFRQQLNAFKGGTQQEIAYPENDEIFIQQRLLEVKNMRLERFDCIVAAWLADGRIFASDERYVQSILKSGRRAGGISHEGGGAWRTLAESIKSPKG